MISCFIIISIALCSLVFYLIFKCKKYDLKELYLKMGVSFLFIVLALVASLQSSDFSLFHLFVILGLFLGFIGDIFLDLKYIDKERTKGYTYGGFITFGIGHMMYMTALIMNYHHGSVLYIILPLIVDVIFALATIFLEKPMKLKYGEYKIISFLYALCLFGTFTFSLFLAIENGFSSLPLNMFLIGSVLFAISDLVLSGTYFGEGKERPIDFILNYVTYYGAQFVIAFLLLFM